ncbi:MAG: zinc ribbon domain-containing protein [Caldilineales bacterium]|nr:zinc ribbon domain-containing protein [Caldilineales bacterium]MCX7852386.1 zinc ribbon domain-containing protein [Caldilineales bacterium]
MHRLRLLLLVLFLCLTTGVAAQGPVALTELQIALWPEYDDPRLLVIMDGTLPAADQTVRIPLPAGAEVHAVAVADENGQLFTAAYQLDANVVTLTPNRPTFRVEYYVPMNVSGARRTATFELPAGFLSAAVVGLEVLFPPTAQNITTDPALTPAETAAPVGQLWGRTTAALTGSERFAQTLAYDNPTGALTVAATPQPAPTTAVVTGSTPAETQRARGNANTVLFILLGMVAGVLIAGGVFLLWRERTKTPAPAAPRPAAPRGRAAVSAGRDRFCRQCGTEFAREDRFCRQCGAPRR